MCRSVLALLAALVAVAVLAVPAAAKPKLLPPSANYPWVQLPAWVLAGGPPVRITLPSTGEWVQPPAWIRM
jgi:hypothetical protein